VISLLVAAAAALIISLAGTLVLIRALRAKGIGQLIREDGPEGHHTKAGTPNMGGIAIVGSAVIGYVIAHVRASARFEASGISLLVVIVGLGVVGFVDDWLGVRRGRNLGLNKRAKSSSQLVVAVGFALLGLHWVQASTHLSFARDLDLQLGGTVWVIWATLVIVGASNAVNLTDGLDGLAAGSAAMVFAAFMIIAFWQFRHEPVYGIAPEQALDAAIVAAAMMGGCAGFLWWNASPARIFMGDTGSLAIGGAMGALAMITQTHLLLPILGGLYVIETLSVMIQIVSFRGFGRRVFRMAPIHHHFELAGWHEFTVIVRFWLMAGLFVAFGLGVFYADFIRIPGVTD
jgi:phospho-N-acetylmuramoyl-pentapeptide-transferase